MSFRSAYGLAALFLFLAFIPACGSGPQGAWEGKVDFAKGSSPTGIEVHMTLTKFLKGEYSGAAEYTLFHEDGRLVQCKTTLEAESKGDGVYNYVETVTHGPCKDGMKVQLIPSEESIQWKRLNADGAEQYSATLKVQEGVKTAKGKAGA